MTDSEYEYGNALGNILRRSKRTLKIEVYHGNGEWGDYDDVWEWSHDATPFPASQLEAELKGFDAMMADL